MPLGSLRPRFRGELSDAPDVLERVNRDASFVVGRAEVSARPEDVDDLVALVAWAREHRIPLTARGGGTSLDAESVPVAGGVVVEFSHWRDTDPLDPVGGTVRVGPGVVNQDLHRHLAPSRRFFPPNPGSWRSSTIGGNVATNASGPRSFRYGPTRRWVHSAEVVLGTGERLTLGPSTPKRSLGPEMLDLIVGSEGTLAFVTSVTLRLARVPARRAGLVVPIPDGRALAPLVTTLANRPALRLAAVEFVDGRVADALRARPGVRLPGSGPLLLLELESEGEESEGRALEELDLTLRGLGLWEPASLLPDADRMWSLRGEAGSVLEGAFGPHVREDVAVPLVAVDRLYDALRKIATDSGHDLFVYGHLGQGHLHPNVLVDPTSPEGAEVRRAMWSAARALGGTVSGEHGVGSLKRESLAAELGDAAVRLLRGWKVLCDPDGILNPGKLLPPPDPEVASPGPSRPAGEAGRTPTE